MRSLLFVSALLVCSACNNAEPAKAPDVDQVARGVQAAAREACDLVLKLPPAPEVEQAKFYCVQTEWPRNALPDIVAAVKAALKSVPAAAAKE
jgi:hypothetical protein